LIPAFSAGNPEIGEIICNTPGDGISTYAQIHSNSQDIEALKSAASTGGKNVVYSSFVP